MKRLPFLARDPPGHFLFPNHPNINHQNLH